MNCVDSFSVPFRHKADRFHATTSCLVFFVELVSGIHIPSTFKEGHRSVWVFVATSALRYSNPVPPSIASSHCHSAHRQTRRVSIIILIIHIITLYAWPREFRTSFRCCSCVSRLSYCSICCFRLFSHSATGFLWPIKYYLKLDCCQLSHVLEGAYVSKTLLSIRREREVVLLRVQLLQVLTVVFVYSGLFTPDLFMDSRPKRLLNVPPPHALMTLPDCLWQCSTSGISSALSWAASFSVRSPNALTRRLASCTF